MYWQIAVAVINTNFTASEKLAIKSVLFWTQTLPWLVTAAAALMDVSVSPK
jgi:hypothetical protein